MELLYRDRDQELNARMHAFLVPQSRQRALLGLPSAATRHVPPMPGQQRQRPSTNPHPPVFAIAQLHKTPFDVQAENTLGNRGVPLQWGSVNTFQPYDLYRSPLPTFTANTSSTNKGDATFHYL
jgi:hypothetical protein